MYIPKILSENASNPLSNLEEICTQEMLEMVNSEVCISHICNFV